VRSAVVGNPFFAAAHLFFGFDSTSVKAVSKISFARCPVYKILSQFDKSFGGNMLFKSKLIRAACALCLVFSMTVLAFADTIRLKDGSIIKGKIVSFSGGKFTIVVGQGTRARQLDFDAAEVESITFDSAAAVAANTEPTDRNNLPQTSSPKTNSTIVGTSQTPDNPVAKPEPSVAKPEPIRVSVKVLADNSSNGWTNSGWVVQKGQKIRIVGSGRVSLGSNRFATPGGVASLPDTGKLMPNQATGALIAVIGDDNNEFIFVGDSREFTATRDGALFLGVNESNLEDNSGAFDVRIEIDPTK
jgi:hypothetical protein